MDLAPARSEAFQARKRINFRGLLAGFRAFSCFSPAFFFFFFFRFLGLFMGLPWFFFDGFPMGCPWVSHGCPGFRRFPCEANVEAVMGWPGIKIERAENRVVSFLPWTPGQHLPLWMRLGFISKEASPSKRPGFSQQNDAPRVGLCQASLPSSSLRAQGLRRWGVDSDEAGYVTLPLKLGLWPRAGETGLAPPPNDHGQLFQCSGTASFA